MTGQCSVNGNAASATLDTAVSNLVTVTGYLSIYDNDELASLGAAFQAWSRSPGYTSVANNPSLLVATVVGSSRVVELVPRNGGADKLAIDIHADQTSATRSPRLKRRPPTPTTSPTPIPTASPTSCCLPPRPQPRPRPGPRRG